MPQVTDYLNTIKEQVQIIRDQAPTDYAPLSHPERMDAVGKITADAMRKTIDAVCKELVTVTDRLYDATLAIQTEAQQFVKELHELGEKRAREIEEHVEKLQKFLTAMANERERFFPSNKKEEPNESYTDRPDDQDHNGSRV